MNDYTAEGLLKPGVYTFPNGISNISRFAKPNDKQVNSAYGLATLSYKNKVFLDLTARNDWSSTLRKENRSYFYPSAASSFILSDIFGLTSDKFNYWKLRASWSRVGNDTNPYNLIKYYNNSDFAGSVEIPSMYPNPDLRPNMITTIEAGMEFSILKNRMNYTHHGLSKQFQGSDHQHPDLVGNRLQQQSN
jgi:outer membrane receptor protein involved in Fe transport